MIKIAGRLSEFTFANIGSYLEKVLRPQTRTSMKNYLLATTIFCFLLTFVCVPLSAQDQAGTVDFVNDIQPILESNCLRCHGEEEPEGNYRIDLRDEALEYIETGDAEASDFYEYLITDDEDSMMPPPDDGGPLDDSDIKLIKTWIDEGASWPAGAVLKDPDAEVVADAVADPKQEVDTEKIFRAIGSLHPAATHLPVGLLLAAGLFAFLSLRGNFVMSDCAYYCLWLGTLGAIGACLTGWWFTLSEYPQEAITQFEDLANQKHKVFWHRTSALVATAFALLLALFASSARNRDPDDGMGWKLGAILLAIGIGLVGHQGGELTWKASHYNDIKEVFNEYIPGLFGEDKAAENAGGETTADKDAPATEEQDGEVGGSGETSDTEVDL